ncbi:hypothetical protein N7481_012749 [Penicillium waksmanii]|uniref:uncharacterized protein n=1 Tax=Penicillium waksmanii TaxID=69791 RepID=UPI0025467BE9|nr:uncharacterized protein N7481_012749 [Penicillium waksmanii]KAJ5966035.1 hypothetical protein N7481_012749 [Penicillium waksmanii]
MDPQEIQSVRSILHLIYHRNKNQHQKAKWWRWLSMLKRTVSVLASLDSKKLATSSHLQHLHLDLIPNCYQAFSTVIADNQFSTLGIVLVAALARLAKATGMRYPSAKSTRVELNQNSKSKPAVVKAVVDRGERIRRDGDDKGDDLPMLRKKQQPQSNDEDNEKPAKLDKEKKKVKKSSSKKKKNAIDDLFSGLF